MNIPENLSLSLGQYGTSQPYFDDDINDLINSTSASNTLTPTKLSTVLLPSRKNNAPITAFTTTSGDTKSETGVPSDFFVGR
jgi:hypothetical protein